MPGLTLRRLFAVFVFGAIAAASSGGCSSSEDEWTCCPVGGNCDSYYVGGSIPAGAPLSQCVVLADVPPSAARTSRIDGHGCEVVTPRSTESCLVRDTGTPRDDGTEADAPTDVADAPSDATDATDAAADGAGDALSGAEAPDADASK